MRMLLALGVFLSAVPVRAQELKIGDPAPKLFVSKWLNGEPVAELQKGTVYVVECWATWCGPCVQAIPHLSGLNTKYKDRKVSFIGLNVWEDDPGEVVAFVQRMGEKMNYVVAIDEGGKQGKSSEAWLAAAGLNGIPASFIVDREGILAWIGHPMGMDEILDQVVEGKFDARTHGDRQEKLKGLGMAFQEAAKAQDWDKALGVLDEVEKLDPALTGQLGVARFNVLLGEKKDYDRAYALAAKLAENELKDNAPMLNQIAWGILAFEGVEKRDVPMALKLALRADELTKGEHPAILDTLAHAYFDSGEVDRAIETGTKAVAAAGDEEFAEELKANLDRYKAAKKIEPRKE